MREYERYQLELIAQEYRSRGYEVYLEEALPEGRLRFDAIAKNDSGAMVLIELINPNLSDDEIAARRSAIATAAIRHPDAVVDFRYIDTRQSSFSRFNKLEAEHRFLHFQKLLRERLPASATHPRNASKQLLALWCGYAALLRSYAGLWSHPEGKTGSVLNLYNSFLKAGILRPAEVVADEVSDDLFQIHDAVLAATEGAIVDLVFAKQLRHHYLWLRKQVKSYNNTQFKGDIRW